MVVMCSWCKKVLGEKEPFENKNITHGLCDKCFAKQMSEIKKRRINHIFDTYNQICGFI